MNSSTSNLYLRIQQDIKSAMKSSDKFTLSTLRMLMAAIKQAQIDERIEINDQKIISILKKSIKQHQQSVDLYQKAKRDELVQKEKQEITIIQSYLPEPISDKDLDQLIQQTILETNADSIKQMGAVIAQLKQKTQNRADMSAVSAKVKAILTNQ